MRPNVHKKIFDVAPIPKYVSTNPLHKELAELGKQCSIKAQKWIAHGGAGKITSIGTLRSKVRAMLNVELAEIDALVNQLLN